jgi:GMP synthase-like glutamine amidotransferase
MGFLYLNGTESRGIDEDYLAGSHLGTDTPDPTSHMDLVNCLEDPLRSRALFCWNINIAASNPQQGRLHEVVRRDDLLTVAIDLFPNDTTDLADYVLPAASFLEFDDLVVSYFNLTLSAQVKAAEPIGESLPNMEIFRRLARAMGYSEAELYESDDELLETLLERSGLSEDFASLAAKGTVPIATEPIIQFADRRFPTPSGRVELASGTAEADGLPRLPLPLADPRPADGRLRLLSPASPWLLNDSFANDAKIAKRIGPATVALHPDDAAARGLAEGDEAVVANETGRLQLLVTLGLRSPRCGLLAEGPLAETGARPRERERAQPGRARGHGREQLRPRRRGDGDVALNMDTLVLQHIACEPPGVYEDVLVERGARNHRVELDEGDRLPDWRDFDAIVAMGGPMSANDQEELPWLRAEKALIAEAVRAGMPFFGACLGVQLLAASLGGEVGAGPAPEVGLLPVFLIEAGAADPVFVGLPRELLTLQWHGDTFSLPEGAVLLAREPAGVARA